jgi:hypothetical protein
MRNSNYINYIMTEEWSYKEAIWDFVTLPKIEERN